MITFVCVATVLWAYTLFFPTQHVTEKRSGDGKEIDVEVPIMPIGFIICVAIVNAAVAFALSMIFASTAGSGDMEDVLDESF